MKKKFIAGIMLTCICALVGCGQIAYPDLPDDAIVFETGEYIDKNDDDAAYGTLEYEGRTYMPYGTIGENIKEEDIDACIGYILQTEDNSSIADASNMDFRIYTLTDDSEHNYLMKYYIGDTLMNQPTFWRAVDTKGEDINTPPYISSYEDAYWEE